MPRRRYSKAGSPSRSKSSTFPRIRLEVQRLIDHQGKHHPIVIDPVTAEHAPQIDRPQPYEHIAQILRILAHDDILLAFPRAGIIATHAIT
ncbi:hypothetical protein HHA04nite_28990 [Halomonas halophila]|uniref:Uncharacterized protein n=1 Tax=Halomonas halophila TaxID=29573 RepID=A0ABQ0U7D6_9GAMM|nr:hypothetical protein HHA04nite_28990 [Halomonas halophila]